MHKRFVILGDPHVREDELALWDKAIEDINQLNPDGVLVLGDLTGAPEVGSCGALKRALAVLNKIDSPWHSIIGNHDLQHKEFATDEDAVCSWLSQVGRDTPWFSNDFGQINIIGLSNTKWRDNNFQHNEIVTGDSQLQWLENELDRLGDKPVLILGHTPPTGADIIKLNGLHLRVGNAFMNENHYPSKVQKIIHENPNILFWFSGHNHMGQHYRDAITVKQGVHFVHTGVVSRKTSRDGKRHSRVLDIYDDKIIIRTFDYTLGKIDDTLEHKEPYGLDEFLNYRKTILGKSMVPREPKTMRQGPGSKLVKPSPETIRLAFLSDLHLIPPLGKINQRVLDWCTAQIKQFAVERIIFGGDMTERKANPQDIYPIIEQFFQGLAPIDYFLGNHEGEPFELKQEYKKQVRMIDDNQLGGANFPPRTFYLHTIDKDRLDQSVDYLQKNWPAQGNLLVVTHFPPELVEDKVKQLAKDNPSQKIWWIGGHKHRDWRIKQDNLCAMVCPGLDYTKVKEQTPAIFIIDWDGQEAVINQLNVPQNYIND